MAVGIVCILLVGIVWIVFGQTLHHDFVNYDDDHYVYTNPNIISGLTLRGIQWAFTHVHAGNWHPLTWISHMLDCQLYGLQPRGHHLTNILLHATAAILLFFALRQLTRGGHVVAPTGRDDAGRDRRSRLQRGDSLWASAFVAALFAIHPLHVESVAWVAERKDVLSGVFFMLALLAYARYVCGERHSPFRYLTVVIFFALGLMCKPTLVTLPFVLLLLDYWPLARCQTPSSRSRGTTASQGSQKGRGQLSVVRGLVVEKIPLFVLSAASCVITMLAQKEAFTATEQLPFPERAANAVVSYVAYLGQTIYPVHLAVLYPYPQDNLNVVEVILALLLLSIVSIIFFLWRRAYPFLLTGWLWFVGMLVPMIGLVQVGSQARADRYTYLPEIGLYILATWSAMELFARWRRGRELSVAVASVIIIALVGHSYSQSSYWHDSERLWKRAIEVTSNNYIAHNNLANLFLQKGQLDDAIAESQRALTIKPDLAEAEGTFGNSLLGKGDVNEAVVHYQKALELKPDFPEVHSNLGNVLLQKGEPNDAIAHYEKALEIKPDYAGVHSNLGNALLQQGQVDEAILHYQKALEIEPDLAERHSNLGNALLEKGQVRDAIACYQKALTIRPDYPEAHYNLSKAFAAQGNYNEAIAACQAALRIRADYVQAYNQMGCLLAALGQTEEAMKQFYQALRIDGNYADAHCNLGRLLAQLGRRDEAVAHLTEALRLKPDYADAKQQLRELGAPAPQ